MLCSNLAESSLGLYWDLSRSYAALSELFDDFLNSRGEKKETEIAKMTHCVNP